MYSCRRSLLPLPLLLLLPACGDDGGTPKSTGGDTGRDAADGSLDLPGDGGTGDQALPDSDAADGAVTDDSEPDSSVEDVADQQETELPCDLQPPVPPALPDTWTLEAEDISVEISRDPWTFTVFDHAGAEVLRSRDAQDPSGWSALGWTSGETRWRSLLSPGWYDFNADLDPWRSDWTAIAVREEPGQLEFDLAPTDPAANGCDDRVVTVRLLARASTLRVEASLAAGEAPAPRAWSAGFVSPGDEGFLGFGERFNRTNQRGVAVYSWAEEGGIGTGEGDEPSRDNPSPNGEAMSYYPVPFFLSTRGYAFWLDSTWRNQFDLATEIDDAWRVWTIGPSIAFEIYVPSGTDMRPWPYHLIDLFTARTGRPMLPPRWAFGPRRRIGPGSMALGIGEIEAMRQEDLAITAVDDAVHFLPAGSHVGRESELAAWIDRAEAIGYRVNGYFNSLLSASEDNPLRTEVERALENGWFLSNRDGEPVVVWLISGRSVSVYQVDFTDPGAVDWYQGMFQWALDIGYSGWMQDFGEYVQPPTRAENGMSGEELHNLYPVLYDRAIYEVMEGGEAAGDWLAFARSGYTGSSAFTPMAWTGDPAASFDSADGLPSMLRAGVNLGISGVPNSGGDINGFHCVGDGPEAADGELLARWIELAALHPNMQDQNACVGSSEDKADIWSSEDAREAWRVYARLHTRLFPYFFTLATDAHTTGAPPLRQLFLEHPDHPEYADIDDQHYLGPWLMTAPIVERGARARTVVLPPGDWLDFNSRTVLDGDATVAVDAPLTQLPLFVRAGAIVPMLDPTIDTLSERETNPDVIGPADVSDVYDVFVFLEGVGSSTSTELWDETHLTAAWTRPIEAPGLPLAATDEELATCDACYRMEALDDGLVRLRISSGDDVVTAGGLRLERAGSRRIRWEIYAQP